MARAQAHRSIAKFIFGALALWIACGTACGTASDIFGSMKNTPSSGAGPYTKLDFYPQYELFQPYIMVAESEKAELLEPSLIKWDDVYYLFYELAEYREAEGTDLHVRSAIHLAISNDRVSFEHATAGEPILTATETWEGDFVGGPAVLPRKGGGFSMWYAGGDGAGIGGARSDDGIHWTKNSGNPQLAPDMDWEGGTSGWVFSPTVALSEEGYTMYYAGNRAGLGRIAEASGTAIGCAVSDDGTVWIKIDAAGRTSIRHPGRVEPVITAGQVWEGYNPRRDLLGAVHSPFLMIDQTPTREVYKVWYTGNVPGDIFHNDASIGYAASSDGVNFQKPGAWLNPVLFERFSLVLPGITEYLDTDEFQPSVIRDGDEFVMAFSQLNPMDFMSYGLKGIGLAVTPPPKD